MEKYFVYILYSEKRDRFYIGFTTDIHSRLLKHNSGSTPSTKSGIPWELFYSKQYVAKTDALKREKAIKKKKSRKYIEYLIVSS